jgi:hypothetical protein
LKSALDRTGTAQDNYTRALVLALVVAHYLHTAAPQASGILTTCRQLASGLGAPAPPLTDNEKKAGVLPAPSGNLGLGLWVGERVLGKLVPNGDFRSLGVTDRVRKRTELLRRSGSEKRAAAQAQANAAFSLALAQSRR